MDTNKTPATKSWTTDPNPAARLRRWARQLQLVADRCRHEMKIEDSAAMYELAAQLIEQQAQALTIGVQ